MNGKIERLLKSKGGIVLDLGCGEAKRSPRFVGIDKRKLPGVDIIHDLETFPWPLPDECCISIIASHLVEHIKPWLTIDFFNEAWRLLKSGGKMAVSTPYGGSMGYYQDPTHVSPFVPATFQYFDPDYPLYQIYKPNPWQVERGFPVWDVNGNMECVMIKRGLNERAD